MNNLSLLDVIGTYTNMEKHILYYFNNKETYIQNVITFITAGLRGGSHIILIENDRNKRILEKTLLNELHQKELDKIHIINNFDFYYENKSFDPQRIYHYYTKNILPYLENNHPVWTWGLVEWGDDDEITQQIEEYEKKVDRFVHENGIVAVCAYDGNRTTDKIKEMLIRSHSVMLIDNEKDK